MPEPFRLGRPAETGRTMEADVRAIRALVVGMSKVGAEATEDLVAGLAVIVREWPETQNGSPTPASASSSSSEGRGPRPHSRS